MQTGATPVPSISAAGKAVSIRVRRSANETSAERASGRESKTILEEDPGLATLSEVEEAIRRVEKVEVAFLHRMSGRDARDERRVLPFYTYVVKIDDDLTVSDLIRQRLDGYESRGLKAIVNDGFGKAAHNGTRLRAVRLTYEENMP